MELFKIECWYRTGYGDEKDFYQLEILAPDEKLAIHVADQLSSRFIYKFQIIS